MPPYPAPLQGDAARVIDRVIISESTTKSNGVEVGGAVQGQIFAPITATIAFEVSADGENWSPAYDGANASSVAATATRAYKIPAEALAGKFMRVSVPVQASDLDITYVLKGK